MRSKGDSHVDVRIFIEPQEGASYATQLALARVAEDLGFDGFFRSDHYLRMGAGSGEPGPTDSWVTLAGLARETRSIRLGTLMSAVTFRFPGLLAVQVAQVDEMSGGRVELGLGTGWYQPEHDAYGVPFPARRFDLLQEQLEIITGMWATEEGGRFDFTGRHYRLVECPALPRPRQRPHPPVIVGGIGPRRTPALAARYADEFNVGATRPEPTGAQYQRVREACAEIGRDSRELTFSFASPICCGGSDAALAAQADRIGRGVAELRANALAGGPDEVVDRIGRYAELGATRLYLTIADLADWDQLELIGHQILPQLT
jgi:F420-dependent oxidoreductase-like protein